jgi:hypothetical protein
MGGGHSREPPPGPAPYRGPLPSGRLGIEFIIWIRPRPGSGSRYEPRWYYPDTPRVSLRTHAQRQEFAAGS